jgi:hypothetical protein
VPTQCIHMFRIIPATNSYYFPKQHSPTDFEHSVLAAVPNESLYIIRLIPVLKRRATAHGVSHRPLTTKVRVQHRASPCEICGDQTGAGIPPRTSVFLYFGFPYWYHSTNAPYLPSFQHCTLTRKANGRSLGTFKQGNAFPLSGSNGQKSTFTWNSKF